MSDHLVRSVDRDAEDLLQQLLTRLQPLGRVAVALSGGVDSSTLLAAATRALPHDRVTALTVSSIGHPAADAQAAAAVAELLGVRHRHIEADTLALEPVRMNHRDRCYHCKLDLFTRMLELVDEERLGVLVEGTNRDDLGGYRPGLAAIRELAVASPLAELGLGKDDVRAVARVLELPVCERPSSACLLTRLPYGVEITPQRLQQIDQAEQELRRHGVNQVRLRDHGDVARIEVETGDLPLVLEARRAIATTLQELGWKHVTLDLQGYREGSYDEVRQAAPAQDGDPEP